MNARSLAAKILAVIISTSSLSISQSPYRISWDKDPYIIGSGTVVGVTALVLDRSLQPLTQQEVDQLSRGSVNRFDRSATYRYSVSSSRASDILYGVALAAPAAFFSQSAVRRDWQTVTLMYLETFGWVGATTEFAKVSVQRLRPLVYNPDVPFDSKSSSESRKSFFSGHSSVAFASAVFISTVYGDYNPDSKWKPYVWAGSLLTAGVVGLLRYEAGAHYPTDILTGAAVGSAIGYAIPWLHRTEKESASLTPGVPGADIGFSLQVKF
jgi:hypothetical protein